MSSLRSQKDSKTTSKGDRYLCFSVGSEEYAIPLLAVREVIAVPEITPVPFSPPHFLGIMNLRGQVISIIDFRLKLGIKPNASQETAVIICDLSSVSIGVIVDSINYVIAPSENEIAARPEIQSSRNSDYITSVYHKKDELILMIDIAKALGMEDLVLATNSTSKAA